MREDDADVYHEFQYKPSFLSETMERETTGDGGFYDDGEDVSVRRDHF